MYWAIRITTATILKLIIQYRGHEGWSRKLCLKSLAKTVLRAFLCSPEIPRTPQLILIIVYFFSGTRSAPPGQANFPHHPTISPPSPVPRLPKSQVFYAIVLHDFEAERADELDAKKGDAITVVAQSNREWFVAKPIGRLGRPGLIPVSFVEIHDPATGKPIPDVEELMDRGDLPKVEDWKRAMFNYKQNSIALGVLDSPNSRESVTNSPYATSPTLSQSAFANSPRTRPASPTQPNTKHAATTPLPDGIMLSADVVSFHFEKQEYWFRIHASFQPYAPNSEDELPPSKNLILFRIYNDFYQFQVALLNTFPREAGQDSKHERVLPFMPGPATNVDDALTATRRIELNEYLNNLCALSESGMSHILESDVIRDFFAIKAGDVEGAGPPKMDEIQRLFSIEREMKEASREAEQYADEVQDSMGRLSVQGSHAQRSSNGSAYEDEGYAASPKVPQYDRHPYALESQDRKASGDSNLRLQAHTQSHHQRNGSSSSVQRVQPSLSRTNSPSERSSTPQSGDYPPKWHSSSSGKSHTQSSSSISSVRPSGSAPSGRSRSHSTATTHTLNNPPISAANPQTAFIKIKIFDRLSDDLIAIRVHPKVTHAELMDKVQARLGGEVSQLRYRDSLNNNELVGLSDNDDLRAWLESTDKHVLFAD